VLIRLKLYRSEQDFETLRELASRLYQMQQIKSDNPHLLAKEYTFAFANIIMKKQGWTQTTFKPLIVRFKLEGSLRNLSSVITLSILS
jgi:hypothetical protein